MVRYHSQEILNSTGTALSLTGFHEVLAAGGELLQLPFPIAQGSSPGLMPSTLQFQSGALLVQSAKFLLANFQMCLLLFPGNRCGLGFGLGPLQNCD